MRREPRRSVVIHGHFYQPPREDPWTGEVPREPSAAPFHDWNRRIHDECYRAVVAAHVLDGKGRIRSVVNTLEWISWDAGPTLLRWMARETPDTYRAFLAADARSAARLGHGNALASPYHHIILPLASRRDKVTEVRWGVADFRRRFGRSPEGMWLPEAAVDMETLEVLAAEDIAFTILGPGQVVSAPGGGRPGRVKLPSGREIAVFVYDGGLSHDVAFGDLIKDGNAWVRLIAEDARERVLVALATDGETFGHHRRWGDMALAAAAVAMRDHPAVRPDNFGAFLARNPPSEDIELVAPSSWSCAHGVERWRSDCGCRIDTSKPKAQGWRRVLREALDELSESLDGAFEAEGRALMADPWGARDIYGQILDQGDAVAREFVRERASRELSDADVARAVTLLEMEHDALAMFTSCGWFFDDIAGLEPLQVLRYAARALDLAGDTASVWEERLRKRLAEAVSADPEEGDGVRLWDEKVRGRVDVDGDGPGDTNGEGAPFTPALDASSGTVETSPDARTTGAADAIVAAVERFVRDPGEHTASRILAAQEAAASAGVPVPFEAQARLGRSLSYLRARAPDATRRVALRLGFGEAAVDSVPVTAGSPVGFVMGVHVHQPVGSFDETFRSHVDDVCRPLLRRLAERDALPLALHVSGPVLEWLEDQTHPWLDEIGELAASGSVEMLLSGFYEPILPALSRSDRRGQIAWMREWLRTRFGVDATGLWLTEGAWEPGLPEDLADTGVRYVLVSDRHFQASGYERHELHRPWITESSGKEVSILPVSEDLRRLVPFRPPQEFAGHVRALQAEGQPLAVLADDGANFGGREGTADRAWRRGWMDRFLDTLDLLREEDVVSLMTPTRALHQVPASGPAYLVSAANGSGSHWKSLLTRSAESNRMHKKATTLSDLCRERDDPPEARRALGRAQCNDAYWHGPSGGLHLPHLRHAVWTNLAHAEHILRRGEGLAVDVLDVDVDGAEEVSVHSAAFSAWIAPARGGALVELTDLTRGLNFSDTLTRRRDGVQRAGDFVRSHSQKAERGVPAGNPVEEDVSFERSSPFDGEDRALFVDRILPPSLDPDTYASGNYEALRSWASERMEHRILQTDGHVEVALSAPRDGALSKRIELGEDGAVVVTYRWDASAFPPDAYFAPELSFRADARPELLLEPAAEATWRYEIRAASGSDGDLQGSIQGVSVTPLWRCSQGRARISFSMAAVTTNG